MSNSELTKLVETWKKAGAKIVFTNGCFDLLHLGHINSLRAAKSFGDKLIVGINSDTSVKRLKGAERPIIHEKDRLGMVEALKMVDAVTLFHEETPEELISQILPDILVKGNDYKIDNIAGSKIVLENGGKVELIPLTDGYSTSRLIEQIKKSK